MVVMAIMSLMAWQGVDGIVRARESNQVRLEQTLRLETVIAQWEQDLASLQETTAVPALTCDGQSVRLTRRTEGGHAGGRLVAAARQQRHRDLAALGRTAGDDHDRAAGELAAHPAVPGQRARPAARARPGSTSGRSTSSRATPGRTASRPATSPAAPAPGAAPAPRAVRQALPSGVRLVLAFAPGSGLNGSLVRDTLLAP